MRELRWMQTFSLQLKVSGYSSIQLYLAEWTSTVSSDVAEP